MSDYSYVIALTYIKTPKANTCYFKLSRLTLDNNTISEEIQSEIEEVNTLNVTYPLASNGCVQIRFFNGIGFGLLFGVK